MKDRIYIIAEAGVNHNGSLDLAVEMVRVAARAGADAVKFQAFRAEKLVQRLAPKADYQIQTTGSAETQFDMLKRLELRPEHCSALQTECKQQRVDFLCTPFDELSLKHLVESGVERLKIPSGEITNGPLLVQAGRAQLPIFLSTGMSNLGEIEDALGALAFGYLKWSDPGLPRFREAYQSDQGQSCLQQNVTLLHCTTEYPAPFASVNLRAMETMRSAFGLPVGYSDHTEGIAVPIAAAALGASVIEKHFTLDRNMPGPDHKASLEPGPLLEMVSGIRSVAMALGSGRKILAECEKKNVQIVRKSVVAAEPIAKGQKFTACNIAVKRPAGGVSPMDYWHYIGTEASRDYEADEAL